MAREMSSPEAVEQYIECGKGYLLNPAPTRCARCSLRGVVAREMAEIAFAADVHIDDVAPHYFKVMSECTGQSKGSDVCLGEDSGIRGQKRENIVCGHPDGNPDATILRIRGMVPELEESLEQNHQGLAVNE